MARVQPTPDVGPPDPTTALDALGAKGRIKAALGSRETIDRARRDARLPAIYRLLARAFWTAATLAAIAIMAAAAHRALAWGWP